MNFLFDGQGMILGDYLMAILGGIHIALSVAVLCAPDIEETPLEKARRRMQIAAFGLVTSWHWYVLYSIGDILVSPPILLGMCLAFLTLILDASYHLCFMRVMKASPEEMRRRRHRNAQEIGKIDRHTARQVAQQQVIQ